MNYNKVSGDIQDIVQDSSSHTVVLHSYVGTLIPDSTMSSLKIVLYGDSTITSNVVLTNNNYKLDRLRVVGDGTLKCETLQATTVDINAAVQAKHIICNTANIDGGKLTSNSDPSSPLITAKGHIWFRDSIVQSSGYSTCIKTPYLLVDNSSCNISATTKAIDTPHNVSRENCVSSTYNTTTFKTTPLVKDKSGNPKEFLYVLMRSGGKLTQIASRRRLYGYTPAYKPLTDYDEFKDSTLYTTPDLHRRINQNGEILPGRGSNYIKDEVINLLTQDLKIYPGLELEAIPDEVINAICKNIYMVDGYLFAITNDGNVDSGKYTFDANFTITDRTYIDSSRIDSSLSPVSDDKLKMSISFTSGYVENSEGRKSDIVDMSGWSTKSAQDYKPYSYESVKFQEYSKTPRTEIIRNYGEAGNDITVKGRSSFKFVIKLDDSCTAVQLAFQSNGLMFTHSTISKVEKDSTVYSEAEVRFVDKIIDKERVKEYTKLTLSGESVLDPGVYTVYCDNVPYLDAFGSTSMSFDWDERNSLIKDGDVYRDLHTLNSSLDEPLPDISVAIKSVTFSRFNAKVRFEVSVENGLNTSWDTAYAYFHCEGFEFQDQDPIGSKNGMTASLFFSFHPHYGDPISIETIREIIAGTYIAPKTNGYDFDELKSRQYEVGIYSLNSYRTTEYFFHDEENKEYEEVP